MRRIAMSTLAALLATTALPALAHDTAADAAAGKHGLYKPGVSIAREHPQQALGDCRPRQPRRRPRRRDAEA